METLVNDFSPGLFFMLAAILIIFIFLMAKFAWKPILNSLEERETGIEDALEAADKARQEMHNLKSANEKILKEARAERDALLKDARDIKDNMIAEAKEEAKAQANTMLEQAKAAIQNEKMSAISDIKNQVAVLSIDIAEKVVKEELSNKGKQDKLVESMLNEVKLN